MDGDNDEHEFLKCEWAHISSYIWVSEMKCIAEDVVKIIEEAYKTQLCGFILYF